MIGISIVVFIALITSRQIKKRRNKLARKVLGFDENGKLQGAGYYFIQRELGKINSLSK